MPLVSETSQTAGEKSDGVNLEKNIFAPRESMGCAMARRSPDGGTFPELTVKLSGRGSHRMKTISLILVCTLLATSPLPAQQVRGTIKRIPPAGVPVPESDRKDLESGVEQLGKDIADLRQSLAKSPALLDLLPDVQIFYNAVRYALTYDEFFSASEIAKARVLLKEGQDRAVALKSGTAPWTLSTGLIVRGYVSRIDKSVQPYGLVIPPGYAQDPTRPRRLDVWYHGRGETLSEINFLSDREKNRGEFTPEDTIVIHPYGRFCN